MTKLRLPPWVRRVPWHWVVLGPPTLAIAIWMVYKVKTEIVDPHLRFQRQLDAISLERYP